MGCCPSQTCSLTLHTHPARGSAFRPGSRAYCLLTVRGLQTAGCVLLNMLRAHTAAYTALRELPGAGHSGCVKPLHDNLTGTRGLAAADMSSHNLQQTDRQL